MKVIGVMLDLFIDEGLVKQTVHVLMNPESVPFLVLFD